MIYSTADQNSVKLELMPGYLLPLKDAIRQPQSLQCIVVRIRLRKTSIFSMPNHCGADGRGCAYSVAQLKRCRRSVTQLVFPKTEREVSTSATILRKAQSGKCRWAWLCIFCRSIEKMPP
jgi:hypothetical protein